MSQNSKKTWRMKSISDMCVLLYFYVGGVGYPERSAGSCGWWMSWVVGPGRWLPAQLISSAHPEVSRGVLLYSMPHSRVHPHMSVGHALACACMPWFPELVLHRIHALFSGTSLIQTTAPERVRKSKSDHSDPTCPPDEGAFG